MLRRLRERQSRGLGVKRRGAGGGYSSGGADGYCGVKDDDVADSSDGEAMENTNVKGGGTKKSSSGGGGGSGGRGNRIFDDENDTGENSNADGSRTHRSRGPAHENLKPHTSYTSGPLPTIPDLPEASPSGDDNENHPEDVAEVAGTSLLNSIHVQIIPPSAVDRVDPRRHNNYRAQSCHHRYLQHNPPNQPNQVNGPTIPTYHSNSRRKGRPPSPNTFASTSITIDTPNTLVTDTTPSTKTSKSNNTASSKQNNSLNTANTSKTIHTNTTHTTATHTSSSNSTDATAATECDFSSPPLTRHLSACGMEPPCISKANAHSVHGKNNTNTIHITNASHLSMEDSTTTGSTHDFLNDFSKSHFQSGMFSATFSTNSFVEDSTDVDGFGDGGDGGDDGEAMDAFNVGGGDTNNVTNVTKTAIGTDAESALFSTSTAGVMSEIDVDEVTDAYKDAMDALELRVRSASINLSSDSANKTSKQNKHSQHRHNAQNTQSVKKEEHNPHQYEPNPPQRRSRVGKGVLSNGTRHNSMSKENKGKEEQSKNSMEKVSKAQKTVQSSQMPQLSPSRNKVTIISSLHGEMKISLEDSTVGENDDVRHGGPEGDGVGVEDVEVDSKGVAMQYAPQHESSWTNNTDPMETLADPSRLITSDPNDPTSYQFSLESSQKQKQPMASPPQSAVASSTAMTMRHSNGTHLIDKLLRQTSSKRQQDQTPKEPREPKEEKGRISDIPKKEPLAHTANDKLPKSPISPQLNVRNALPDPISVRPDPPPLDIEDGHQRNERDRIRSPPRIRPVVDPSKVGNYYTRQQQRQQQQQQQQNNHQHQQNHQQQRQHQNKQTRQQKLSKPSKSYTRQEWTTPLPFKKVHSINSKISSSSFTFQTENTTNTAHTTHTTTTSRFWDEVEDFSDPSKHHSKHPQSNRAGSGLKRNEHKENHENQEVTLREGWRGLHGDPQQLRDTVGEQDFVILKKSNEKHRQLQAFFSSRSETPSPHLSQQLQQEEEKEQQRNERYGSQTQSQPLGRLSNPRSKQQGPPRRNKDLQAHHSRQTDPNNKTNDDDNSSDISRAFSLHLNEFFSDEDISALEMGDSATIYHQRAAEADPNHWKKKYERLKEETRALREKDGEKDDLADEGLEARPRNANHANNAKPSYDHPKEDNLECERMDQKHGRENQHYSLNCSAKGPPKNTVQMNQTRHVEEDQTQAFQQRSSLLQCGDYGGGKKAKDRTISINGSNRDINGVNSMKDDTGKTPNLMYCSSISNVELDWMLQKARKTREASTGQQLKRVGEGDDPEKSKNQEVQHPQLKSAPEMHLIAEEMVADGFSQQELWKEGEEFEAEMFDVTNADKLKKDPSFPQASHLTQQTATNFVMMDSENENDVQLLQKWNRGRGRPSKSLADDLSTLRGVKSKEPSADGSQSELSENAKLIFEAALKYDIKTLRSQRSRSASRSVTSRSQKPTKSTISSNISSMAASLASSDFANKIPPDFVGWFELTPSPGSICIPLIPLLDDDDLRGAVIVELLDAFGDMGNNIGSNVRRIRPRDRVDSVVDQTFAEFLRASSNLSVASEYMGPVVADGDDGSIRFADASSHLRGISEVAKRHAKDCEFQDAIDIYNTLLRSCENSKHGLVGQLIASTLHNLCVLHMWNKEYDQALPYCREALRIKSELVGDSVGVVNSWSNLGLINYAMESFHSALSGFRKSIKISSELFLEGHGTSLSGRLVNNMACVALEMSTAYEAIQSDFDKSLRVQKGGSPSSSFDSDSSAGEDLLSISITIFNIGVICAKQRDFQAATSHVQASLAIQRALLDDSDEVLQSTIYYLELLEKLLSTESLEAVKGSPEITPKFQATDPSEHPAREPNSTARANSESKLSQEIPQSTKTPSPEKRNVMNEGTTEGQRAEMKYDYPFFTKSSDISHPMLSLGSLRDELTIVQRVHQSLEGCAGEFLAEGPHKVKGSIYSNHVAIGRNQNLRLICNMPSSVKNQKTLSQNLINYGLRKIRRREIQRVLDSLQTELDKNMQRYGSRHPLVGQSHHSIGLFHLYTESYSAAISHFEKSIKINTNALGVKHPDIASTLMFKGLAQLASERFDDSMASMLRVRRTREDALGNKHPEIAQVLNNIACVQYEIGDHKKAELLLQEALDLQREVFTTEPAFLKCVSIVLCNIAFVHAKLGSFPKALIELEGALQIRQDILLEEESLGMITENMAHILAIHQLQHGVGNLDEITKEYIEMLRKT